jgi:hypothetical protein
MRGNSTESTAIALSINTRDYFLLDDELIVFSPAKQEYFGIGGAARLVFDAVVEVAGSIRAVDVSAGCSCAPLTRKRISL